jgi:hypothetical protein
MQGISLTVSDQKFREFLCEAKRSTYAAENDFASVRPVFSGSHQLEYRKGALFYRDIYFGGTYFVGQETVYHKDTPFWAMSYAGGSNEDADINQFPGVFQFLQAALRKVPQETPFRGPIYLVEGIFSYTNRILGTLTRFSGVETISVEDRPIYHLNYSGGVLKF